jgi:hypothetical protein
MTISNPILHGRPVDWTLAQFRVAVRRLILSRMRDRDEARKQIDAICHVILYATACFNGSQTRLRAARCFARVDIKLISRQLREPKPGEVDSIKAALHLTRKYAIELGCFESPKPVIHPIACPSRLDVDDWMRWAPAYLQATNDSISLSLSDPAK